MEKFTCAKCEQEVEKHFHIFDGADGTILRYHSECCPHCTD